MPDPNSENQPIKTDVESLTQDALRGAGVRFDRVFSRADEVVVVLPGQGAQMQLAMDTVDGLQRGLNRRIVVMPESGASPIVRKVVLGLLLAFAALATFALVYPYVASMWRAGKTRDMSNTYQAVPGKP
ncbi:MAG: hypothetical protein IT462_17970 [Planctomycetes bacterium]|nr:hypothetical protein [Planctomycetota bacterium]